MVVSLDPSKKFQLGLVVTFSLGLVVTCDYLFYSSCCYIGWPKDVFPVHVPCSFCVKMR